MLMNHSQSCSKWLNKPSRQKNRIRRGLSTQFGHENAAVIFDSLELGEPHVSLHAQHKIRVRPDTTDLKTFAQIFGELPYEICLPGREPRLILDCGANVGYASILFAKKYPTTKILAIEPDESNFKTLCENLRRFKNVKCLKAAIWGLEKDLRIMNPNTGARSFRVEEVEANYNAQLKGLTIDRLLFESQEEIIDILKIDIEGAEREIFKNGTPYWLKRTRILLIELHDFIVPGCSADFYEATKDLSFIMFYDGETIIALNTQLL